MKQNYRTTVHQLLLNCWTLEGILQKNIENIFGDVQSQDMT